MIRRRLSKSQARKIILTSVVLLILTALIARQDSFSVWEANILQMVYALPASLGPGAYVVTQFGSIFAVLIVGALSFFMISKKVALEIGASGLGAYVLAGLLKQIIARPRPSGFVEGISQRYEVAAGLGYPSGHAAVASALALTLWFVTPKKYRWFLILWVFGVGLSRMYLGLHAPLDIIGGISIGLLVAATVQVLASRFLYPSKKIGK